MLKNTNIRRIGLTLLLSLFGAAAFSRQQDSITSVDSTSDTVKPVFRDPIKRIKERGRESINEFRTDKLAIRQDDLLEQIKKNIYSAKAYLKRSIDTADIIDEMDAIRRWYTLAGEGVFTNKGPVETHRNLATTSKIYEELLRKSIARRQEVDKYLKDLMRYRNIIDSLTSDSSLYAFSNDSVVLMQYIEKLRATGQELRPADSILERTVPRVRALQLRINDMITSLSSGLEEMENYRLGVSSKSFKQEVPRLWKPSTQERSFRSILRQSVAKNVLSWKFYVQNNQGNIFLLVLLIAASAYFLRNLKLRLAQSKQLQHDYLGQHVLRYPLLSAIVIVVSYYQFVFPEAPFVFSVFLWGMVAICLSLIYRSGVSKYWMLAWIFLLICFFAACCINLILEPSHAERWMMLVLSLIGCVVSGYFFFNGHRGELREKAVLYFLAFMGLQELAATIANLYGSYNFAKTSLVSGFCSAMIAVQMLWTIRLINEGLFLASEVYKGADRKLFYVNFDRIGKKAPTVFYIFLLIGWLILFGRNFYIFKLLTDPIQEFLFRQRTIGDFTFSVWSVLSFFLILSLSVIISRIVSFFASGQAAMQSKSHDGRAGIGSWLLLVRIFIIGMGLLLAFAAAGIPLDKVTLILGALGVGIGFGLQALVNNLVSGLIIAFEKPVNVGDIVEVAGRAGTIKSIGFRSSMLAAWDGAVIVIPNGDLLNQHVVNWTQGSTLRRGDVAVGVAYGTDLAKATALLRNILETHSKILKYPAPAVLNTSFSNSSIDFVLYFWLPHSRDLLQVKSDVINAIQVRFREAGIEIPFPHQDLRVQIMKQGEGLNTEQRVTVDDKPAVESPSSGNHGTGDQPPGEENPEGKNTPVV